MANLTSSFPNRFYIYAPPGYLSTSSWGAQFWPGCHRGPSRWPGASALLISPCAASLYSLWLPPLGPGSPGSRGLRKPRREEKERKDGEKLHEATELGCLSALSSTSEVRGQGSKRRKRGSGYLRCPAAPPTPSEYMLQVIRTTSDDSRRLGLTPGNVRGRSPHFCSNWRWAQ